MRRKLFFNQSVFQFLLITFFSVVLQQSYAQDNEQTGGFKFQGSAGHARDIVSWMDFEQYDVRAGSMKFYFEDMRIEGNGKLPIVIARKHANTDLFVYGMGGIGLDVPRLRFKTYVSSTGATTGHCGQHTLARGLSWVTDVKEDGNAGDDENAGFIVTLRRLESSRFLTSPVIFTAGKHQIYFFPREHTQDWSRFPDSAAYVSPDNWYISCADDNVFKVHAPDGNIYTMGLWKPSTHNLVYVTRIEDPFNNHLIYEYEDGRSNTALLKKIVASDGRQVDLSYNSKNIVTDIKDNSGASPGGHQRHISYATYRGSNEQSVLAQYPDGSRSNILRTNTKNNSDHHTYIRLPADGWLFYRSNKSALTERHTFSSQDSAAEQIYYFEGREEPNRIYRSITSATNSVEYVYGDDKAVQRNQLLETRSYGKRITSWPTNETPKYKKETTWKSAHSVVDVASVNASKKPPPSSGFKDGARYHEPPAKAYLEASRFVPSVVRETIASDDASPRFIYTTRTIDNYDAFGRPLIIHERSNDDKFRKTRLTYFNSASNSGLWLNGLVARRDVDSGVDVLVNEYDESTGAKTYSSRNGIGKSYSYTSQGDLASITNAEGHTYTYSNYRRGIATREQDASGRSIIVRGVADDGTVTAETIAGNTTRYKYDSMHRLVETRSPEGRVTRASWNFYPDKGQYQHDSILQGRVHRRIYDGLGRIIYDGTLGGGTWSSVISGYDNEGRLAFETNPSHVQPKDIATATDLPRTQYTYDGLGRLIRKNLFGPGDVWYQYNKNAGQRPGELTVRTVDARAQGTIRAYRSYGTISGGDLVSIRDPLGTTTTLSRDSVGRLTRIDRDGLTRSYEYNNRKELSAETHPENGTTHYSYFDDGMLWQITHQGTYTTYSYDPDNRTESITASESPGREIKKDYSYEVDGLLQGITVSSQGYSPAQSSEVQYVYDADRNLTDETLTIDGRSFNLKHKYDDRLTRYETVYPGGIGYNYHPTYLGRPTKIESSDGKTVIGSISYDTFGNWRSAERSGLKLTQSVEYTRYPKKLEAISGTLALTRHRTYSYDGALNITKIETDDFGLQKSLSYDKQNRLTYASLGQAGTWNFEYDVRDNITQLTHDGVATDYEYDETNNHLRRTRTSGVDRWFSTDPRGNVTQAGGSTLTFNAFNQVSAHSNGETYVYDGHGRRVKTTQGEKIIYQMYDIDGVLRYREEPLRQVSSAYLYLDGRLLTRRDTCNATDGCPIGPRIGDPESGDGKYTEIFRDDFDGNSVSSNFFVPTWAINHRDTVNNVNSCSQSGGILNLAIKNVGNERQACYLISNVADLGPGDDSTLKVEYRANVSSVKAEGAWFAGWLYPDGLNPDGSSPAEDGNASTGTEYDVFEYMPTWDTAYNTAIHDGDSVQRWVYDGMEGVDLKGLDLRQDAYHTFAMEWDKNCVVFYVDGIPVQASDTSLSSKAKKHRLYLTMEAQTGTQWFHWPVGDFSENLENDPAVGRIDWVSVSRKDSIDPALCSVVDNGGGGGGGDGGGDDGDNGLSEPTVIDFTMHWPNDGWWQVQNESGFTTVCDTSTHGTSCVLDAGTYQVINHTTDQRWTGISVPNNSGGGGGGGNPGGGDGGVSEPTVVEFTMHWPAEGWWQVQNEAGFKTVCDTSTHGTSCVLDAGTYQVINHTTGQRWTGLAVPGGGGGGNPGGDDGGGGGDGVSEPTVVEFTMHWPAEGWWQVQNEAGYTTVCDTSKDGTSCVLDAGTYQVINHTTDQRWTGITVPNNSGGGGGGNPGSGGGNSGASEPTVVEFTMHWPDDGWWQVQDESGFTTVCDTSTHGTSCVLDAGTYQVINHTTGQRWTGLAVPGSGGGSPGGGSSTGTPTPPTVTGQAYSKSAIEIQWSGATDSDGTVVSYDVYRNGVMSHSTNGRSWWQEGLSADTAYSYEVVALDNDGKRSTRSASVSVRTAQ